MGSEFFLVAFLLLAGMAVYWTMVLMPRQRNFQKRQRMARTLAEGDEVITGGGLVGRVKQNRFQSGYCLCGNRRWRNCAIAHRCHA